MTWIEQTRRWRGSRWEDVSRHLSHAIQLIKQASGRIVVVGVDDRPLPIVVLRGGCHENLRAETLSNHSLVDPRDHLTDTTVAALRRHGWRQGACEDLNFSREWRRSVNPSVPANFAVETLRDVYRIQSPRNISIKFTTLPTEETSEPTDGGQLQAFLMPTQTIDNPSTGKVYRVLRLLAEGGFGAAYRVAQVRGTPRFPGQLCLKIAERPDAWHREAYFGQILNGVSRSIAVHESFAAFVQSRSGGPKLVYCLVTEFAAYGDLKQYLVSHPAPWTETKACREVAHILRVLVHLHQAGAVHRDLTPRNILVTSGRRLKLGDFGIAEHRLGRRAVRANVFAEWFAPTAVAEFQTASIPEVMQQFSWMRERVLEIRLALLGEGRRLVPVSEYLELCKTVDPASP